MSQVCPYCRAGFEAEDPARYCTACGTPHHTDCWQENGGCTVFGCTQAPAPEEKVRVTIGELGTPFPPPQQEGMPWPGGPPPPTYAPPQPYSAPWQAAPPPGKSRNGFILLGVFLGFFGAHNFYAGYHGRAVAQLLITLLTCFWGGIVSWIWAIVELCTVDRDRNGAYFT